MPRAIWTGAISFGLVYIPVQLHSASHTSSLDLDMLDKNDFSPVGYQRINKRTGKVVDWGDIVKGYQYEKGKYVVLSEEDFRQANVKATQTVDIQQFVEQASIPPEYFETPYYLSPGKGGAKVYALMLNTLRFEEEIRAADDLDLPEKSSGVSPKELAMAERLIDDMSGEWKPSGFKDTYSRDLLARVKEKVKNREMHKLTPTEKTREPRQSAQVIDLMEVLKKSLEQGKGAKRAPARKKATHARKRKSA